MTEVTTEVRVVVTVVIAVEVTRTLTELVAVEVATVTVWVIFPGMTTWVEVTVALTVEVEVNGAAVVVSVLVTVVPTRHVGATFATPKYISLIYENVNELLTVDRNGINPI